MRATLDTLHGDDVINGNPFAFRGDDDLPAATFGFDSTPGLRVEPHGNGDMLNQGEDCVLLDNGAINDIDFDFADDAFLEENFVDGLYSPRRRIRGKQSCLPHGRPPDRD